MARGKGAGGAPFLSVACVKGETRSSRFDRGPQFALERATRRLGLSSAREMPGAGAWTPAGAARTPARGRRGGPLLSRDILIVDEKLAAHYHQLQQFALRDAEEPPRREPKSQRGGARNIQERRTGT